MKKINGKKVNITAAGYLYIDGKKVAGVITPISSPGIEKVSDADIREYARNWAFKHYIMVNN